MVDFDPIAYINEPRWQESRLGLERTRELLDRMGRPQDKLKFAHVAGTNGKGSVCAYLESVLRAAGYKTGLFTSPYILTFEERIRVNGENISSDDLRDVTLFVREHAEAMAEKTGEHPTEFELMTAVAFEHFARSGCDIVVCEVGLGGRLDSTNIIDGAEVCVITRIGLDHVEFLGDTPAAIAREKAGIIKPGCEVVSWPQEDAGALESVASAASAAGCDLHVADLSQLVVGSVNRGVRDFSYKGRDFTTTLLGSYQPSNAAVAIEATEALRRRGWAIDDDMLVEGIAKTAWPGRFEVVSSDGPVIIVDGGHNPQGANVLAESLRDVFPGQRVVFLMSVLADKDYRPMIESVMPLARAFVCATPPNPRALAASDLKDVIQSIAESMGADDVTVECAGGFEDAFETARSIAGADGVLCAFGSLYSISSLKAAMVS